MTRLQKDVVRAALRAEDVADALGIISRGDQRWRGRWLRARRCGVSDHSSEAFGIARDGMWHCYSCDQGGDLFDLIAASQSLDIHVDFTKVLIAAAAIAGVDEPDADPFLSPTPVFRPVVERPTLPPQPPLQERVDTAVARAAWIWERLRTIDECSIIETYLTQRGLNPEAVLSREDVRATPMHFPNSLRDRIENRSDDRLRVANTIWWTMASTNAGFGLAVPVRHVETGKMVDLRVRRVAPRSDQPKIIGMVGGVTAEAAQIGKPRRLVGCYGHPHAIEMSHVVIVEGLPDYLTALQVFQNAHVLGAVEAGTLALVTAHAARALAARGGDVQLTIVEQADPERLNKATGKMVAGAADAAINEDPNAATKVAVRLLGAARVGWLFCEAPGDDGQPGTPCAALDGKTVKDLNDLVRIGWDAASMVIRWKDLAQCP